MCCNLLTYLLILYCISCKNWKRTLKRQFSVGPWDLLHINEVSKCFYPSIGGNPNFGYIFLGKKCSLSVVKYSTCNLDHYNVLDALNNHHLWKRRVYSRKAIINFVYFLKSPILCSFYHLEAISCSFIPELTRRHNKDMEWKTWFNSIFRRRDSTTKKGVWNFTLIPSA